MPEFNLVAHNVKCNEKTEGSEDELFFKVFWKSLDGTVGESRIPGDDGFNMKEGSIANDICLVNLANMKATGKTEAMDFAILVMESDNGPPSELYDKVRNEMANHKVTEPGFKINCEPIDSIVAAINLIGQTLATLAKGDDDFLGMTLVQVRYENGGFATTWKSPIKTIGNHASYRFQADGADYEIDFDVRFV